MSIFEKNGKTSINTKDDNIDSIIIENDLISIQSTTLTNSLEGISTSLDGISYVDGNRSFDMVLFLCNCI